MTHIKINNDGDCYDLLGHSGSDTFGSLRDLIEYYMEGGEGFGTLRERDGAEIELKYPLPTTDHSTERSESSPTSTRIIVCHTIGRQRGKIQPVMLGSCTRTCMAIKMGLRATKM